MVLPSTTLDIVTSVRDCVMNGRLGRTNRWASLWGRFTDRDHAIVGSVLQDTGLATLAERRADQLSGGQRQRVAIARCLAQEPQLVLADEPVSNLDPAHAERVLRLITGQARKRSIGVVFTSHQPDLAARFAERIVAMKDGRIALDCPASDLTPGDLAQIYGTTDLSTPALRLVG